jgi:hypothetical protein
LKKKLKDVFGQRNDDGGWIVPPRARYYDSSNLEVVFRAIKRALIRLPGKRYLPERKQWFLVFDRTKHHQEIRKKMGFTEGHDQKLFSETKQYWHKVDDGDLQAIFFIDSLAALVPDVVEDDEEKDGSGIAFDAREFSKWIKQVKGKLRSRHAAIFVVNQLRENPMAKFGPKESEPGGNAPRFYSDVRNRIDARSVPPGWARQQGKNGFDKADVGVEESVEFEGGEDLYQYKHIKNIKNKKGTPYLEGMSRVWIKDGDGKARGFDPVYDTYQYLLMTGQVKTVGKGKKKEYEISLLPGKSLDWFGFKCLILAETENNKELWAYLRKEYKLKDTVKKKGVERPLRLRKWCFNQVRKGLAFKLMEAAEKTANSDEGNEDGEDAED